MAVGFCPVTRRVGNKVNEVLLRALLVVLLQKKKFEQVGTKGCTCATTISHYLDQRAPPNVFLEKWKQQKVRRVMVGREGGTSGTGTFRVSYLVHAALQSALLALHLQKGGNKKFENKGWEGGRYVGLSHSQSHLPGARCPAECDACSPPEKRRKLKL